ncbi:MAG: MurT ligase domain-containing protein [Patescibacteria group bacterium]|nr:DUF1727 domain-containing protein [Patescibacteria group bacterium]
MSATLKLFKLGGGTSLPGLAIEKYFPSFLKNVFSQYKKVIFITGTNGKTTTQRFLKHLLEAQGIKTVSNSSGANLLRGIATSVINDTDFSGKVRSDAAVIEVEEATMPILTKYAKPDLIVVTNLFRDQLDAYGEVIKTRSYIKDAISNCSKAKLILNGDDENVKSLRNGLSNKTVYFYIRDSRKDEIFFEPIYVKSRKVAITQTVYAKNLQKQKDMSFEFDVFGLRKVVRNLRFAVPGIQNIYSALAALCTAESMKHLSEKKLKPLFANFRPAFGRGELVSIGNKKIQLLLIKNPASFTANINMLKSISRLNLLIIINDNIADGRDVSWLWDTRIEILAKANISSITVSGIRAHDMTLRLKYALIKPMNLEVDTNISKALDVALSKTPDHETLFILPTYTAMFEVRDSIGNIVKIKEFWK